MIALAVLLPLLVATGPARAVACHDPVGVNLPVTSASEAGVAAEKLVQLLERLDAAGHEIRSLLILRNCRLVLERYRRDLDRDFNHDIYSVTKSVNATLIGILQYQGKLGSLDAPLAEMVPRPSGVAESSWEKARTITLRNAMQMASGLEYSHDPSGHPIYQLRVDRLLVALRPPLAHKPGTHFQYSDGDATLTGAVITARAGQPLYAAAKALLFDPLQMRGHDWLYVDMAGRYPGGWGLRLRPMDMVKVGQLYLQDCVWNGARLCDSRFIADAWAPGVVKTYGLHWWRDQSGAVPYFAGRGFKGQLLLVFPEQQVVVGMTAVIPSKDSISVERQLAEAAISMIGANKDPAAEATAQARLTVLQAAGFHGELRRSATPGQDAPARQ